MVRQPPASAYPYLKGLASRYNLCADEHGAPMIGRQEQNQKLLGVRHQVQNLRVHKCTVCSIFYLPSLRRTTGIEATPVTPPGQPSFQWSTSCTHQRTNRSLVWTLVFKPVWWIFCKRRRTASVGRYQIHPFGRPSSGRQLGRSCFRAKLGRGITSSAFSS